MRLLLPFLAIFFLYRPAFSLPITEDKHERLQVVRAAIIYRLVGYIDFPKEIPVNPITICIYKNHKLAKELEKIVNRHLKEIHIVHISRIKSASCTMSYLEEQDSSEIIRFVSSYEDQRTLLIGSSDIFLSKQGMISLIETEGRINVDLNLSQLNKQGYIINPDLITVARRVLR